MRLVFLAVFLLAALLVQGQHTYLFIGTYTGSGSKGIYVYRFHAKTGRLEWVSNTESIVNPSYLTIAPNKKYIYACTDTRTALPGSVSAFAFDKNKGELVFINKQSTGGANPVYLAVHKSSKWVVVGNYTGGNLSVFKIGRDGSLAPLSQTIDHTGKSRVPERQEKPHVHCTVFSPDHQYVYVPDLGIDKIMTYVFNEKEALPLHPSPVPFTATLPGSGPRHLTFHPNRRYAYLVEEMAGAVVAYHYNQSTGRLDSVQRILAHPHGAKGPFSAADIHISPDGKFLYVSNRGTENNIAMFSIDGAGKLKSIGYQATLGKVPRNFTIDPSGNFILVANQQSNNVVVFKRNKQSGLLTPTGIEITIPEPSCLQMMKP